MGKYDPPGQCQKECNRVQKNDVRKAEHEPARPYHAPTLPEQAFVPAEKECAEDNPLRESGKYGIYHHDNQP